MNHYHMFFVYNFIYLKYNLYIYLMFDLSRRSSLNILTMPLSDIIIILFVEKMRVRFVRVLNY